MWIRSQDRKSLSDVNGILVDTTIDKSKCYIYGFVDRGRDILGEYSTKEKAMEVLNDIYFRIKYADIDEVLVYEMPKDDEVSI